MAVIYIDADMPEACTKLMEERKEEWIEKWTERCAFYNICKHKDTIRNDYKPVDCPLKSVDSMKSEIGQIPLAFTCAMEMRNEILEIIDKYCGKEQTNRNDKV